MSTLTIKTIRLNFDVSGQTIVGDLFIPYQSTLSKLPGVVICNGRNSNRIRNEDRSLALAKAGLVTLSFDFRGTGDSQGEQTLEHSYADTLAAIDVLLSQSLVDPQRLGLYGVSFGGYIAACASGYKPIKALALSAPASLPDEWWGSLYTLNQLKGYDPTGSSTKATQAIQKYSGHLLIVEHEFDDYIPSSHIQSYLDNATSIANLDHHILKDVKHRLRDQSLRDQSHQLVADWCKQKLTS